MFNLVIDSKLRGSNLAHERPLCATSGRMKRTTVSPYGGVYDFLAAVNKS
jgi:hypothetical protein